MAVVWTVMIILVSLISGLQLASARPSTQEMSANEFFYSIDEAEREDFIIWQLGIESQRRALLRPREDYVPTLRVPDDLKIDEETFARLRKLRVPRDFSRKLYDWVRGAYGLSPSQVVTFLTRKKICAADRCFDFGDLGNICCPF